VNAPVEAAGVTIPHIARREWPYAIGIVTACFIALSLIFRQEAMGAFRVWIGSETYNHCFLILPIALYMIWQRRDTLAGSSPKADFRALLLIPLLSLAWFGASIFSVLEAQQFVVITIFQAMLLGILGWPVYRKLMAPFLYLYFLVPSGEFLVPALQDFTARFAVLGLQLLEIPVYSDGILIDVPSGSFVIAEACAGLRFLIAAIAFGVFYATEIYESRIRRAIFVALSIVVPIVANGFRALGLIAASEYIGSAAAVEADHVTYGWVFFSLVLVALIFIGRTFSDRNVRRTPVVPISARPPLPADMRTLAFAGALAAGLAAMGPAAGLVLDAPSAAVALQEAAPGVASMWRPVDGQAADWRPVVVRADRQFSDSFTDGAHRVDRFVALYLWRGRTNNLIRSENRIADEDVWNTTQRGRTLANYGGKPTRVNSAEIVSGGRRRLVWWLYALDDSTAASLWDVKRRQVHAYVTGKACPSAMLAISTDLVGDRAEAAKTLQNYLNAVEPMPAYLCGGRLSAPEL